MTFFSGVKRFPRFGPDSGRTFICILCLLVLNGIYCILCGVYFTVTAGSEILKNKSHGLLLLPLFPVTASHDLLSSCCCCRSPADHKDVSVMMSEMDVNAIAGTLKLYFRELPEPLFTDELYPNFAGGISESAGRTYQLINQSSQ